MANTYLIELGINDSTQDIVRKCNQNFRTISANQVQNTKQGIRRESSRVDAVLDGAIGSINDAVNAGTHKLDTETKRLLQDVRRELEAAKADIIDSVTMPIGIWIHCDFDPNEKYPGTEWQQTTSEVPYQWHRIS